MLEVTAPARLRLTLLGLPAAFAGEAPVRVTAQKGLALLAYLGMHAGRPVSRTVLADLLWGDRGDAAARQNLRQAILTLRRDLGPGLGAALRTDDQGVSLAVAPADVDALHFLALAQDRDPQQRRACLQVAWYPLLDRFSTGAEAFDEWITSERHRVEAIAVRTFSALAHELEAAGDSEGAILAMERLIAIDPGEEERHRRLIELEARVHGTDPALARAKSLAALLRRELDLEPAAETRALVAEIRRQAMAAPPAPEPPQTPAPPIDAPVTEAEERRGAPGVSRRLAAAAVALTALVIAGLGAVLLRSQSPAGGTIASQAPAPQIAADPSWRSPGLPSEPAPDTRGLVAIAVMPFTRYEQDEQLLAEMLTDDLTNLLSRVAVFRVISRQTSATYAGRAVDAAAVGAELGIRYLLEGSVSRRNGLLRVNAELVDTRTRLHVWSGRFERAGTEWAHILDEIVASLGRQLQIEIEQVESERVSADPDVHELIFLGRQAINDARSQGVEALKRAEGHFSKALERAPENPHAQSGLAAFHAHMALQLFASAPQPHLAKAEAILRPLIERYPSMSGPYFTMGHVETARNRNEAALDFFRTALRLNPSHPPAHAQIGRLLVRLGHPQEGLEHVHYAMRLSPRDPALPYWHAFAGLAALELHHYRQAIEHFARAEDINPGQPRTALVRIAAYAMAGDMDEARWRLAQLQEAQPHLTHERLLKMFTNAPPGIKTVREGMLRVLGADQERAAVNR